jgi:hypothetical protein
MSLGASRSDQTTPERIGGGVGARQNRIIAFFRFRNLLHPWRGQAQQLLCSPCPLVVSMPATSLLTMYSVVTLTEHGQSFSNAVLKALLTTKSGEAGSADHKLASSLLLDADNPAEAADTHGDHVEGSLLPLRRMWQRLFHCTNGSAGGFGEDRGSGPKREAIKPLV